MIQIERIKVNESKWTNRSERNEVNEIKESKQTNWNESKWGEPFLSLRWLLAE